MTDFGYSNFLVVSFIARFTGNRHIVITTSGFVVTMLPDTENSCRTIQNL